MQISADWKRSLRTHRCDAINIDKRVRRHVCHFSIISIFFFFFKCNDTRWWFGAEAKERENDVFNSRERHHPVETFRPIHETSLIYSKPRKDQKGPTKERKTFDPFFFPQMFLWFDGNQNTITIYIWNKAVNRYNAVIGRCRNNN